MPEPKDIISKCEEVFKGNPNVLLVSLFGSYAMSRQKPNSDIDLLVWLTPTSRFHRTEIWSFWDARSTHLPWNRKVSMIVRKWLPPITVETILLDLPEEHVVVFDPKQVFEPLKRAILKWRKKNGSQRLISFSGRPYWLYNSDPKIKLGDINFTLELPDVA